MSCWNLRVVSIKYNQINCLWYTLDSQNSRHI